MLKVEAGARIKLEECVVLKVVAVTASATVGTETSLGVDVESGVRSPSCGGILATTRTVLVGNVAVEGTANGCGCGGQFVEVPSCFVTPLPAVRAEPGPGMGT